MLDKLASLTLSPRGSPRGEAGEAAGWPASPSLGGRSGPA